MGLEEDLLHTLGYAILAYFAALVVLALIFEHRNRIEYLRRTWLRKIWIKGTRGSVSLDKDLCTLYKSTDFSSFKKLRFRNLRIRTLEQMIDAAKRDTR